MDMILFGERVKELRNKSGLTQRQFAEALGISVATVTSYEKAQKTPSLDTAAAIAKYFKVSLDWLCNTPTPKKTISTYGEAIRAILDLVEANALSYELHVMDTKIDDEYDPNITHTLFYSPASRGIIETWVDVFFKNYEKMVALRQSKDLPDDVFNLWITSELTRLDEYSIRAVEGDDNAEKEE